MGADPESRFEEIYGSSYGPLLGYALRRCPDPEDAADVVAETFMVAWRRIEEVPRGGETKLWLFGVARKVLASQRRGERRHEQRTAALRAELAASPLVSEPPAEDLSQVGRVFRALSDDDRELLSLVAWELLDPGQSEGYDGAGQPVSKVRAEMERRGMKLTYQLMWLKPDGSGEGYRVDADQIKDDWIVESGSKLASDAVELTVLAPKALPYDSVPRSNLPSPRNWAEN